MRAEFEMTKPLKDATITFRITKGFRFRMWLGMLFMKCGVRIMGGNSEIVAKDADE